MTIPTFVCCCYRSRFNVSMTAHVLCSYVFSVMKPLLYIAPFLSVAPNMPRTNQQDNCTPYNNATHHLTVDAENVHLLTT